MKTTRAPRYTHEQITSAVTRIRSGESLSLVAKELGASKSTVSRWLYQPQNSMPAVTSQVDTGSVVVRRSRKFADRSWTSLKLAFKRLNAELVKDKPQGVRDLALVIAVLWDKASNAMQALQTQGQGTSETWAASEETLLILKRHRQSQGAVSAPETGVEANLGGRDIEQEKNGTSEAQAPDADGPKE